MSWHLEGNELKFDDGNSVRFQFPIKQLVEIGNVIVVCLAKPPKTVMTENVFAISTDGKILWQIERIAQTATDPVNSYTSVRAGPTGTVMAYNWNGTDVTVDLATGKVISTKFVK